MNDFIMARREERLAFNRAIDLRDKEIERRSAELDAANAEVERLRDALEDIALADFGFDGPKEHLAKAMQNLAARVLKGLPA
jgi:hypothetical protein